MGGFSLALLLLAARPTAAPAGQSGDFGYSVNGDGTVTITSYTGAGGVVIIPPTIETLPVAAIGPNAFQNNNALTAVEMPAGVIRIGSLAFQWCRNLTNVVIPNSVVYIGEGAFTWCLGLRHVTLPDAIPSIEPGVFSYSGLVSLTIPDSVTIIKSGAFFYCVSLANVTLGAHVADIAGAFGTSGLTSITLPASVTNVGSGPFNNCVSLATIEVDPLNPAYSSMDGVLFNQSRTTLIQYPGGKAGNYYTVTNRVASFGDWAFAYCRWLTDIRIPGSVTNIGANTFGLSFSLAGLYFEGNAPGAGYQSPSSPTTVYYLTSTSGWGPSYAGFPTRIWQPRILTDDGCFGVRTNCFGFNISWASGKVVRVEACTNLRAPGWLPVGTNTLVGGVGYFSDSGWTNHPIRFYRIRSP